MRRFRDLPFGPHAFAEPRAQAASCHRAVLWLFVAVCGCGPVGYFQQVNGRASTAVAWAMRGGAETAAPYEYTSAVAYLDKAREEGDHAEYQVAIEFGRRAEDFANRARVIALDRAAGPPKASP